MAEDGETSTNPISVKGCGRQSISIQISPTTGGEFSLSVDPEITIEGLKKLLSKRLRVSGERICLLYRDKQLQEGSLQCHGIVDGGKVVLLPNVETGLIAQKPDVGIMQALESLNDSQVNDFLCGKAPLNLTMRLGDHMMLIQLQLSTVAGARPVQGSSSSHCPCRPPSLTQASRNLQHTLRRLSADVFSGRDENRRGSVYSGTFSGALNPALQDQRGRPRKDVATIVHILNDLLCSAPELRRVGRQNVERRVDTPEVENVDEPSETASEDQNLVTRGKMEQLRLVMGERKERRRQRKQKPYSRPPDSDTVSA